MALTTRSEFDMSSSNFDSSSTTDIKESPLYLLAIDAARFSAFSLSMSVIKTLFALKLMRANITAFAAPPAPKTKTLSPFGSKFRSPASFPLSVSTKPLKSVL